MTRAEKADKPSEVTLVSPDGQELIVSSPTAYNNLVYGAGYTVKSGTTEDAAALLAPQVTPTKPPEK